MNIILLHILSTKLSKKWNSHVQMCSIVAVDIYLAQYVVHQRVQMISPGFELHFQMIIVAILQVRVVTVVADKLKRQWSRMRGKIY